MSNKANINSFPAFFKDKQHDMYSVFFSEHDTMSVIMIGFTDAVRRDSYTINALPSNDVLESMVPISEEEFRAAIVKAHGAQLEWYESKLSIQTTIPV